MRRPTSSEYEKFLWSWTWKKVREAVRVRDGCKCQRCGKLRTDKNSRKFCVHHIIDGQDFPDLRTEHGNLVLLCHTCHDFVHSAQNTDRLMIEAA